MNTLKYSNNAKVFYHVVCNSKVRLIEKAIFCKFDERMDLLFEALKNQDE